VSDPNLQIVGQGVDGPTLISAYDAAHKTEWCAIRSYQLRDGAGSFLTFQNMDSSGKWYDAVGLNGGFIKNAAGKVSSDIDFLLYSEGKPWNVSFCGAADGYPASIVTDPREVPVWLGSAFNGFAGLWLTTHPLPAKYVGKLPGNPTKCVYIGGGIVPVLDP